MTNKFPNRNDLCSRRRFGHWCLVICWSLGFGHFSFGQSPKIASLVPAATDLIVGMGAADHLVAISNWDPSRPEIGQLPRVGDYETTDWEKLAVLRPDVMIVFMAAELIPAGVKQRADNLHIKFVNVKTERLDDIFQTIKFLGELLKEPAKAEALTTKIRSQLKAVEARVAGRAKIATLVARDEEGYPLIAKNTFIDDLLAIAGGENVASDFTIRYPNVDRERVVKLSPNAIIQLIPGASPQVIEQARKNWQQLPSVPAVRDKHVTILTEWYALQPGSHVGDLAEKLADVLHPTIPSSRGTPGP